MSKRKLRVFLCHSSQDKPVVRDVYQRLLTEDWIDPWLDEEKLLPGQDWGMEIEKAVETADAVIVCLSNNSVTKEGYVQRELKFVLDIALEKPEGTIFIIPLRLDECDLPRRLRSWQYVDYFPTAQTQRAYQRLLQSLRIRFDALQPEYYTNEKAEHDELEKSNQKELAQDIPIRRIIEKTYAPETVESIAMQSEENHLQGWDDKRPEHTEFGSDAKKSITSRIFSKLVSDDLLESNSSKKELIWTGLTIGLLLFILGCGATLGLLGLINTPVALLSGLLSSFFYLRKKLPSYKRNGRKLGRIVGSISGIAVSLGSISFFTIYWLGGIPLVESPTQSYGAVGQILLVILNTAVTVLASAFGGWIVGYFFESRNKSS
jgi:hypothetical protein